MRSAKAIFFIFLSVVTLLFVQAEKNRLHKLRVNSYQVYDDSSISIALDDDSISLLTDDDDLDDDSSESVVRHISPVLVFSGTNFCNQEYERSSFFFSSGRAATRKNSPSFLKVFRI